MKYLYKDYYDKQLNNQEMQDYPGVQFVAYDKEYDDEALDNEEYENKHDELDLIEKHFKININVYTNDEPEIIQIDRRSITKYDDTLNLMRYNNHFMYITNLNQIRHSYRCKKCSKFFKNMEACNRHEKKCDELVNILFPVENMINLNQSLIKLKMFIIHYVTMKNILCIKISNQL
jgi:hypothetical protein